MTLDPDTAPGWAKNHDIAEGADLRTHPTILAAIEEHVAVVNQQVSRAESIRQWRLLENDWTVESGELTPTMKIKHPVIAERASTVTSDIYDTDNR